MTEDELKSALQACEEQCKTWEADYTADLADLRGVLKSTQEKLEAANAEIEQLNSKIGKQLSEIFQQDKDYSKIHKTNVAYEFKIEKLESENKKLTDENARLQHEWNIERTLHKTNVSILEKKDLENTRLRAALEFYAKARYSGYQASAEEDCGKIAREALSEPVKTSASLAKHDRKDGGSND